MTRHNDQATNSEVSITFVSTSNFRAINGKDHYTRWLNQYVADVVVLPSTDDVSYPQESVTYSHYRYVMLISRLELDRTQQGTVVNSSIFSDHTTSGHDLDF